MQSLRVASDFGGSAAAVAIYQASQSIYEIFDKATVLYEGRQIYFGPAENAKDFFERQGWTCPQRYVTLGYKVHRGGGSAPRVTKASRTKTLLDEFY